MSFSRIRGDRHLRLLLPEEQEDTVVDRGWTRSSRYRNASEKSNREHWTQARGESDSAKVWILTEYIVFVGMGF